MKKVFLTFGSHNDPYRPHIHYASLLTNQVNNLNIFDEIKLYTSNDLINDTTFWKQHEDFILNNKRGFGYWIWKPYLIKKTMDNLNDGDIILYLDSQSRVIIEEKEHLLKYIDIVKEKKILFSYDYTNAAPEINFNKSDLIYKLNMENDKSIFDNQFYAHAQLIYVCKETRELINSIYSYACEYHNIDDTPSIIPNHPTFIDHRHDQSVFSLLVKKNKLYSEARIEKCLYHRCMIVN